MTWSTWRMLILAVGMALGIGACAKRAGISDEADVAAIRAIGKAWEEAYKSGDIEAMRALYAPDAVLMPRNRPAFAGVDAILGFFARGAAAYDTAVIDISDEIEVIGDAAFTVGRFWLDGVPKADAPSFKDAGRYFILFKRDAGGNWKIYRDIDQHTPDADPANPPSTL